MKLYFSDTPNPNAKVLADGGTTPWESSTIMCHLAADGVKA